MQTKNPPEQSRPKNLLSNVSPPVGVRWVCAFSGEDVSDLAFGPDGDTLASACSNGTAKVWSLSGSRLRHTLAKPQDGVDLVALHQPSGIFAQARGGMMTLWDFPTGEIVGTPHFLPVVKALAFGDQAETIVLLDAFGAITVRDPRTGRLLEALSQGRGRIWSTPFDLQGEVLATVNRGGLELWNVKRRKRLVNFDDVADGIAGLAINPRNHQVATVGREGRGIALWDAEHHSPIQVLEGHTGTIGQIKFSPDGRWLASMGTNGMIRLWKTETWESVALHKFPSPGVIAFHPTRPLLATTDWLRGEQDDPPSPVIQVWEVDYDVLFRRVEAGLINYASAKVVLVGDSGVGKTGLGWRLAHGEFKEHPSTHGQRFWVLKQLSGSRQDGTECEAVLWDLAGQPDYRLIHALFLDDADLALVLFDPTRDDDTLNAVRYWQKHLNVGARKTPSLLIAARTDRGSPTITDVELNDFCKQWGFAGYVPTSAMSGEGFENLIERMQGLLEWDRKPLTMTTATFKRAKDFVLGLKEDDRRRKVLLTPGELRTQLQQIDRTWTFTDDEMLTAVGHLATHGYVTRLKTSQGQPRILLAPDLLNNLAASFVLEARRNVKGLGSLEEKKLLSGGYTFPELAKLETGERDLLLDSAVVLFLAHNVCFRETDPLNQHTYLVFPELINLKRPVEGEDKSLEDGVAYTVSGAVENVYASMVVLMGYTQTFTRTNQWRNHARYVVGDGKVCGFRLEDERAGELDFVLHFGADTPSSARMVFQGLFESFLDSRNLAVRRIEPVYCKQRHLLNRAVVRDEIAKDSTFVFCNRCGDRIDLTELIQPSPFVPHKVETVEANRRAADKRTRFEEVLFRLKMLVTERQTPPLTCFISYAWGEPQHERWVATQLAPDVQKAGIAVLLDRWDNSQIGASVVRFVERIGECSHVIVVGTPLYRQKTKNVDSTTGNVVATEWEAAGFRMLATEGRRRTVLPALLDGDPADAFPTLLHGRVYADFRRSEGYFTAAFDLITSVYAMEPNNPAVIDLRESLRELEVK